MPHLIKITGAITDAKTSLTIPSTHTGGSLQILVQIVPGVWLSQYWPLNVYRDCWMFGVCIWRWLQVHSHLIVKNLHEPFQAGFCPLHGSEAALLKLVNDLLLSADWGALITLVRCDLVAVVYFNQQTQIPNWFQRCSPRLGSWATSLFNLYATHRWDYSGAWLTFPSICRRCTNRHYLPFSLCHILP